MTFGISYAAVTACALVITALTGYQAVQDDSPVIIMPDLSKAAQAAADEAAASTVYRFDGDRLTIEKDGQSHGWVISNQQETDDDQNWMASLPVRQRAGQPARAVRSHSVKHPKAKAAPARQFSRPISHLGARPLVGHAQSKTRTQLHKFSSRLNLQRSLAEVRSRFDRFVERNVVKARVIRTRTQSNPIRNGIG